LEQGHFVVGLRRRTSTFNTERVEHLYKNPNFIMEWGNITDSYCLTKILSKHKPNFIFNAAAQSHVRVSYEVPEETWDSTAMGCLKLLNVMLEVCPKSRFVQFSSSEMFGISPCPITGYTEESKMLPASPYAVAKLAAHNIVRNYRESYGLHASCGIMFNMEGPKRGETFVTRKISMAASRIKTGVQDKLYLGNLDSYRDWGLSKEYMEGIILLSQHNIPDDIIFASGETHSVREYLQETFDLAGLSIEEHVVFDERLCRPEEVPYLLGDYSKAKEKLGWQPKTKFKELVRIMYEHEIDNLVR